MSDSSSTPPEQGSPSIVSDVMQWLASNLGIWLPTWEQLTGWARNLWQKVVPGGVPDKFPPDGPIKVDGEVYIEYWKLTKLNIELFKANEYSDVWNVANWPHVSPDSHEDTEKEQKSNHEN